MGKDSFLVAKGDTWKTHKLHINFKNYNCPFLPTGAKKKYFKFPIVNKTR